MKFGWFSVVALLLLVGCSGPRFVGRSDLKIVDQNSLPAPTRVDLFDAGRSYYFGPFDRIAVEVFGVDSLSRTVQADANGRIALPLAGEIDVSGKTPAELSAIVAERLRGRYVRNPQVTINVAEAVSQTMTVSGAVQQPGSYPVVGNMTLMRAIARAQGTTEYARSSQVVVFRTVGSQQMAGLFDLRAIQQGIYPDPPIYAHDTVVVGESSGTRLFRYFLQGSSLLTAPLIAILQH